MQDYPGVWVGTNAHVPDLAYAGDLILLSNNYGGMQYLLELVNLHAAAAGKHINASKPR